MAIVASKLSILSGTEVEAGPVFSLHYQGGPQNSLRASILSFSLSHIKMHHRLEKKTGQPYIFLSDGSDLFQQRTSSLTRGSSLKLYGFSLMCFDFEPVRCFKLTRFPIFFPLALVAEPLLSHLTISNVTWGSVSIPWKARESAFDSFLVEVRDSDHLQETVVRSVPTASRTSVIANLKASSNYTAHLHGLLGGQRAQTLMVQTTTGISHQGVFTLRGTSFEEHSKNSLAPYFSSS